MARQRPPGRKQLDEESELRRKRRSMAAAAAARAGGALSLTAVLLGAPALVLPAAATPTDGNAVALTSATSAGHHAGASDTDR